MLKFIDYSYENLKDYAPYIARCTYLCADFSLGSVFMWHERVNMQFAIYHNTFVMKLDMGDEPAFSYPIGEDVEGALDALEELVKAENWPLMFFGINEEILQQIKNSKRFDTVSENFERKWSDYLYNYEEMLLFSGKKFSGQRNHINRFAKTYGAPDFRPIEPENISEIEKMLEEYEVNHGDGALEKMELQGTHGLLRCFKELKMYGGALYVDGKVAGFTIGELVGDMLVIHVEKALTTYTGVYPTLFNSFMKYLKEQENTNIRLVNREDDSGDAGLRTSKMQYKPVRLLHKYLVKINSPVCKINEIPEISFAGGILNEISEEDKSAYLDLNIDKENNIYWGYDYEEDSGITEVDENTFYDMQLHDYVLGASVNFAVREEAGGELIGETIVYHFTVNGYAEIGGRIAKAHQGKGHGTKAFAATADFAKNVLGVKPVAKCYKQNKASYGMITGAGFEKCGEDETFYHFEYVK